MSSTILDKARVDILLGDYGSAPSTALADQGLLPKVQEYRRLARTRMQPLDREGISHKIPAADFHVSRKIDGEFTAVVFRDGMAFTLNPGGTVRVGLPVLLEAAKLFSDAGVREAMIAAELYVQREGNGRTRVHDVATVARKPQSSDDLQSLRLAVFDVMSADGLTETQPFAETWKLVQKWFSKGKLIRPVETRVAKSPAEIQKTFQEWVESQGAEGIVARSDAAGTFKIKPRYSLDLAVLGFTESLAERQGMLHDMLLGIKRPDDTLQVLGRVGGGFSDDQRREFLSDLKDMAVDSEYAEVNGDNVAYQMVKPDWVVEVNCLDLMSETTRGGTINRMVLEYRNNGSRAYHVVTKLPLATIISPQFVRRREDKHVRQDECGVGQISNIVDVQFTERDARQLTLPKSEILRREVFTKELKGQTMVRKFLMWTTNKATQSDEFPAFVLHYTDFSPNRKDPLARDLRVSNSRQQIDLLWDQLKAENVKGGWNLQITPGRIAIQQSAATPEMAPPAEVSLGELPTPIDSSTLSKSVEAESESISKTGRKSSTARRVPRSPKPETDRADELSDRPATPKSRSRKSKKPD